MSSITETSCVWSDFASFSAKDHELQQAVNEREAQLTEVTQSLAEYKHRALQAEVRFFSYVD
jgi:hypothetical protein